MVRSSCGYYLPQHNHHCSEMSIVMVWRTCQIWRLLVQTSDRQDKMMLISMGMGSSIFSISSRLLVCWATRHPHLDPTNSYNTEYCRDPRLAANSTDRFCLSARRCRTEIAFRDKGTLPLPARFYGSLDQREDLIRFNPFQVFLQTTGPSDLNSVNLAMFPQSKMQPHIVLR